MVQIDEKMFTGVVFYIYMNFIESFLVKKLKFLSHFWKFSFVEFLGAITRPRSSVFKSTKPGEADWSIVHMDTLVLTNQRRPLIFRVHVDNLSTNQLHGLKTGDVFTVFTIPSAETSK